MVLESAAWSLPTSGVETWLIEDTRSCTAGCEVVDIESSARSGVRSLARSELKARSGLTEEGM